VAILLIGLAVASALVGLRDSLPQNAVAWVGLSAVFGIAGFVAIAPWAVAPMLRLLALPLRGATGRIAVANNQRNPHRVTSTTAALSIGVALIAMITVLTSSATATADKEISQAFGSDLSIGAPPLYRPYDHSITQQAAAVPGVAESTFIRTTNGQRRDIPIAVFGVQPDRITAAVNLTATSGDLTAVGGDRIALDSRLAARYGVGVGDEFTADFRTGPATFDVVAVFDPVVVFQGILTDLVMAERLGAPAGLDTSAYFLVSDDADITEVRNGITAAIEPNPALQVQDTDTLKRNFADSINQLLGLVFAMLALAVIIAVLSIANTLLLSVHERTAEIGMLRAVGATRTQVRLIVVIEAAILGVFGAACGLALGVGYGVLLRTVMQPLGLTEQSLPWPWLAVFLACGAAAGVLASLWPAVTASRTDVLAAITTE
jgi:putative ABC transport system permease protein